MSFNCGLHLVFCFCTLLFFCGESRSTPPASALYKFRAIDLCNTTKPGTMIFRNDIGIHFMVKTMKKATKFIFKVFEQDNIKDRKHGVHTKLLTQVIDEVPDGWGYYFPNATDQTQTIVVSADYCANFPKETLKDRIRELVYHEMTHVWQWYGNESTPTPPSMLFEGIAEYVPLVAGLKNYADKRPGGGDKWNEGYEVTAFFLQYCDSLKPGFVAQLNRRMRYNYNDSYFKDLLGKSVEDLWKDYKNKYGNENQKGGISRFTDVKAL